MEDPEAGMEDMEDATAARRSFVPRHRIEVPSHHCPYSRAIIFMMLIITVYCARAFSIHVVHISLYLYVTYHPYHYYMTYHNYSLMMMKMKMKMKWLVPLS